MRSINSIPVSSTATLLNRVYRHIVDQPVQDDNVSLLSGQMGYALLEAYARQYYPQTDDNRLWERISTSLATVQAGKLGHSFASGITGVAWGFLHLCNQGLLNVGEIDAQDIVADLDEPLFDVSLDLLQQDDYDYLHGGLSAGLYYLERQPSDAVALYVERLVDALSASAVCFPNGDITWLFTDFGRRSADESSCYNPGLSHGTASIVTLLSLFYERGYARQACPQLVEGALQWMWNHRNHSGQSVFPTILYENQPNQDSRLSWCYGDLGIANAFWLCGHVFRRADWQAIAQQTMLKAAQRRSPQDTHVSDAGICHGSAGVAYLFRRFARRYPHPLLTEAADYWLQQTYLYATPEPDENVFPYYINGNRLANVGLLDGEGSVGLVLLAELGVPSYWDRFLLLS